MDADRALKKLFKLRATDLLPVTGDRGAQVVSRLVPEPNAVTRRPDFVLKLKRGSEVYLRHLEFEMKDLEDLALPRRPAAAAPRKNPDALCCTARSPWKCPGSIFFASSRASGHPRILAGRHLWLGSRIEVACRVPLS
jgi:hypothetical protein